MTTETIIVSETGSEPITTAYLKNYIRVSFDTDDAVIASVLTAARILVEAYIEQSLVSKNYKTYFTNFEKWDMVNGQIEMRLPISPVTAISAVKQVAADGTETATTDYFETGLQEKVISAPLILSLENSANTGYIVEYTAFNSSIQEPIKDAIAKLAGELYENRQNSGVDISIASLPYDVKMILTPYKKTFI